MSQPILDSITPGPAKAAAGLKWSSLWFGWWVAGCLVLLAYSSQQQLRIQRHLLEQSRHLKAAVAEAAAVSEATNRQLEGIGKLDAATTRLSGQLSRIAQANATLRTELQGLEVTVSGIDSSVATLDRQARESAQLLSAIARKSDDLQSALAESLATGKKISGLLTQMARVQGSVTDNLGEMVRKTERLRRFSGGE